MFAELTQWIIDVIRAMGAWGVFIGVLIEAIVAPIPSPIIIMFAGFAMIEPGMALLPALLRIFLVITVPACIAGLIGNYVVYGVCYKGGKPVVDRFQKLLGFSWEDIINIKKKVGGRHRQNISLVVLRAIPIMPLSLVSAAAGVLKVNWRRFGFYSLLGMIVRNMFLAFLGWKVGEIYFSIADRIDNLESFITYTIVALAVLAVVAHKLRLVEKIEKWVTK